MTRRKTNDQDQIPLSETQNTAITGRKDIADQDSEEKEGRPYRIKEAKIKEDLCQYSYEIISGVGIGDTHNVKGSALIETDLRDALAKLNVHLAYIDDAFKQKGIEVKDIDTEHNNDLTFLYYVTGFKIKGNEEAESVILIGTKSVSMGHIEVETPRISLDSFSSYKWHNELRDAVEAVREEVALYKEGKCIPVEVEETKPDPKQTSLFGPGVTVTAKLVGSNETLDEDFAEAAL
jgi:hypothetical protein